MKKDNNVIISYKIAEEFVNIISSLPIPMINGYKIKSERDRIFYEILKALKDVNVKQTIGIPTVGIIGDYNNPKVKFITTIETDSNRVFNLTIDILESDNIKVQIPKEHITN